MIMPCNVLATLLKRYKRHLQRYKNFYCFIWNVAETFQGYKWNVTYCFEKRYLLLHETLPIVTWNVTQDRLSAKMSWKVTNMLCFETHKKTWSAVRITVVASVITKCWHKLWGRCMVKTNSNHSLTRLWYLIFHEKKKKNNRMFDPIRICMDIFILFFSCATVLTISRLLRNLSNFY